MRRIQEIEIELPQIVLERADAAYAQIRQQAVAGKTIDGQESQKLSPGSRHPVSCSDTFCHSCIRQPPPESWDTAAIWQSA